jgi:hypothetical protein
MSYVVGMVVSAFFFVLSVPSFWGVIQ